jgi:hypothetical protein
MISQTEQQNVSEAEQRKLEETVVETKTGCDPSGQHELENNIEIETGREVDP